MWHFQKLSYWDMQRAKIQTERYVSVGGSYISDYAIFLSHLKSQVLPFFHEIM